MLLTEPLTSLLVVELVMSREPEEGRDYVVVDGLKIFYNRPKPTRLWLQEQEELRSHRPLTDRQQRMTRGWKR